MRKTRNHILSNITLPIFITHSDDLHLISLFTELHRRSIHFML
jgi:hypothetical protein